ncbi:hypothetical protein MNEG_12666 [Monoraphidium neglectum]|uniref:Uncharacterized protein n=1 Tax=Monoraphidium neglectum TaxID=145388 RepID=A0A0D2M1G1_9CHLO|nr:hypothetical protein MNEG_12666 [Monoraphidium neglectum]KIY95296.1 hypothetical protein MNEG_12666 [Monoraphidium neglectum]|eukprot:XP_013894316.1 hypothetical protein MNEG_12666 [Monoraphidium neglectum]
MVSPGASSAYADARDTNAEDPILSISSTESDSDDSLCSSMDARQARLPHGAAAAAGAPWWWRIAVKRALGAKPRSGAGGARSVAWGAAAALGPSPLAEVRLVAGPRASEPDALSSAGSEDAARDGADQPKQRPGGQATPRWRARGQHRLHQQLHSGFRDVQQQQQVEEVPLLPHPQHPRAAACDAERGAAAPAAGRAPAAAAAALAPSAHYLPGVRYHTECMPRRWWSALGWEVLGIMSLIGYMAIPLHFTIIFLRAVTGDARAAVFGSAILATLLLPAKPLMWAPFLEWVLLKSIRQYFDYSVLVEDPPALEQRAIWAGEAHGRGAANGGAGRGARAARRAEYPHGVFPLSQLLAVSLNPTRWPGLRAHSVGASVLFRVPLWRQMLGWMGIRPASRHHFTRLLLDKGAVKVNPATTTPPW